MAGISASTVMKLRKISGQGMMDCKKALQETEGNIDDAMEILRKKGLSILAKRSDREASEGIVVGKISDDGKTGVLATLCCETDFVAKSDGFVSAAELLSDYAFACSSDEGRENLVETQIDGKKFNGILTETASKTGEKIQVSDYIRYKVDGSGFINIYVHFNSKVGTMVEVETVDDSVSGSDILRQAAKDIAMHITATKPLALDKDGVDPEIIEGEKAVFAEQVKDKPSNIIEKIIEGKMNKFFAENCLLQQPFVKDDSKSVAQVISQAGKESGGEAKIKRFVRFELGQ